MEELGLIHSEGDNVQRCLRQTSESYDDSQLHPKMNGKLVKMFVDKVDWERRMDEKRGLERWKESQEKIGNRSDSQNLPQQIQNRKHKQYSTSPLQAEKEN